jgi:hypothetical protein
MGFKPLKHICLFVKKISIKHIEVTLAAIALLVAIFLFWETQRQVKIAMEANEITREALRQSDIRDSLNNLLTIRSLAIAESSFVETTNQNRFYNNLHRNERRAFLVVENYTLGELNVGETISIEATVTNVGPTVAKNVFIAFEYFVDSGAVVDLPIDGFRSDSPITIMPQKTIGILAKYDIKKPPINWFIYENDNSFDRGERGLWFTVFITYQDVFRKDHEIRLYGVWNRKTNRFDIDYEVEN